jgi:MFS family permease
VETTLESSQVGQKPTSAQPASAAARRKATLQELRDLAHRREFLYPMLGDLVLTIANNALYLVELLYLIENGYTASDVSFFLMCAMGAFGISLVIGGYIVDRLGFRRAMTVSLIIYAVTPLVFFYAVSSKLVLTALALLAGFNSAIAQPAASVYTYSVIDRKQLGRLFLPLYILSGIGWIGYFVGGWLLELNPLWAFAASTVLIGVSVFLFNYGVRGTALTVAEGQSQAGVRLLPRFTKFLNRKFALLALLSVTIMAGSFIFNFIIPMSVAEMGEDANRTAGILMSSAFALSMIVSLVLNRVFHFKIANLRHIFIGNIGLSLIMVLAGQYLVVATIVWACFIVLVLQANVLLFARLWLFIDVKSGLEQAVYQSLSTVTGFLMYLVITLLIDRVASSWLFVGYAVLTLISLGVAHFLQQGKDLVPDMETKEEIPQPGPDQSEE